MTRSTDGPPVIGLTTYLQDARWGVWHQPAALLPYSYVAAVATGGGVPILLPPCDAAPADVLAVIDGLILTGGGDVDPSRYGRAVHPRTSQPQPARDDWEFGLASAALEAEIPLLAVCRGMEVLNVVRGGTLIQHLPDGVGHHAHAPAPGAFGTQHVRVADGSALHHTLGPAAEVLCYHHQAIETLGQGLTPVAWAEDGTIEAVELIGHPSTLGVQWHPEAGEDHRVFADFLRHAWAGHALA